MPPTSMVLPQRRRQYCSAVAAIRRSAVPGTVPFIDTIDVLLAAGPVVVAGLGLTVVDRVLGDQTPTAVRAAWRRNRWGRPRPWSR